MRIVLEMPSINCSGDRHFAMTSTQKRFNRLLPSVLDFFICDANRDATRDATRDTTVCSKRTIHESGAKRQSQRPTTAKSNESIRSKQSPRKEFIFTRYLLILSAFTLIQPTSQGFLEVSLVWAFLNVAWKWWNVMSAPLRHQTFSNRLNTYTWTP